MKNQASLKHDQESTTLQNSNPLKYIPKEFTKYHFSFLYPSNWIIDPIQKQVLLVCKAKCPPKTKFCSNFVINTLPKKTNVPLENYASAFKQNVLSQFEKSKLVNEETITINGLEAVIIDYKMLSEGIHLGGTTALITIKGNIITINCTGENQQEGAYLNHRKIFETIIMSVKQI